MMEPYLRRVKLGVLTSNRLYVEYASLTVYGERVRRLQVAEQLNQDRL